MESIFTPAVILGITGLLMGLFLAFASKKFEVEVDPKVEKVLEILPGINCGACGYPGCSGYAEAIALHGAEITFCSPGGAVVASKIGELMGMTVKISENKMVAKLLCQGDCNKTTKKYEYEGSIQTCASLALYSGGDKSCHYSCIGHGDCVTVCPVNAISLTGAGLVYIDEEKCVSCSKCIKTCPKKVLSMLPQKKRVTVKCSSKEKGIDAKKSCSVACIACGICAKVCPVDAIIIEHNLAKIISEKCVECGLCSTKCPTKAIENNVKEIKKAEIISENCIGCTACARVCPTQAITGVVKEKHFINPEKCIGCQLCFEKCKFKAIKINVATIENA
ncbi:MAG: RnfABCDGE type electron transport complex subunit B [Fusobacteriaceae bacterium]